MTRDPMRDLPRLSDALHDADDVIGRITVRGQWDRRYKPAPGEPHTNPLVEVVAGVFVMLLLFVGLGAWAWIGWAMQ